MSVSSGKLFARACIPPGMDLALEGLAREVLKEQPRDIYLFAARHFQKLVQIRDQEKSGTKSVPEVKSKANAHSAGLSPSSTQASDNAGLIPETPTDADKPIAEEAVITSQDAVREISLDTNGAAKTGIGLGPGVAALAASTGTVAILGATADTTLDTVEGVKKVAEEVVNDVKVAAEEAVKDGKKVVEDVGKEAEGLVGKAVGGLVKSPSADDKQSPTSPIQDEGIARASVNKDSSLPTSPLAEVTRSSLPTSPIIEGLVGSKDVSPLTSPIPQDGSKDVSGVTSPILAAGSKVFSAITSPTPKDGSKDVSNVTSPILEAGSKVVSAITSPTPKDGSKDVSGVTSPILAAGSNLFSAITSPTPKDGSKDVSGVTSPILEAGSKVVSAITSPTPKDGSKDVSGVTSPILEAGSKVVSAITSPTPKDGSKDVSGVTSPILAAGSNLFSAITSPTPKDGSKDVSGVTSPILEAGSKVVSAITSPTPKDGSKDVSGVTSPILAAGSNLFSAVTSPVPQDGSKVFSEVTSPILEAGSKVVSTVTSPIPEAGSKDASPVTSPIPQAGTFSMQQLRKEIAEIKEEATLSLSSLPEDSIPSSIKEDVLATSSPSVSEDIVESLAKSDKSSLRSTSLEGGAGEIVEAVAEVQEKVVSRPASGGILDQVEKRIVGVVDDVFPDPPPPEIQETTAMNIKEEAEDAVGRAKRSVDQAVEDKEKQTPGELVENIIPVSVTGFESKIAGVKAAVGDVKDATLTQFSTTIGSIQDAVSPARVEAAVVEGVEEKARSVLSQNPEIEVSGPSRPQSSGIELFAAPVADAKQEAVETAQKAVFNAGAEVEKSASAATQETVEAVKEISGATEVVRPTSAQVEKKAEEVVNEVVQTVTEMTTAATTIQATFRGHQTRQNLRKIADQEEMTDGISSDLDKDADVTLSLDAKSSDTKEELSETVEDSFPPPLNDGDSELLSTSTEKEELQPVVNVTISAEPVDSRAESVVDSEKVTEEKTQASESEHGSLEGLVEELPRAASVVSESTVSIGDSISAVKGSETDSALSVNEDQPGDAEARKGAAATTIQASFRGFQTRQNLQKMVDDTQLPVPEPLQDLPFEDVADEDDLPPPPEECDIEPPLPVEEAVETPRSPETGEKLKKPVAQVSSAVPSSSEDKHDDKDKDLDGEMTDAAKLALLQRPQQCDELPEHRGEVAVDLQSAGIVTDPELKGDLVNGTLNADASSAEVDDSSLSSAATKIQAGARGYLSRKLMKDTFSTTAPSITDSQSVGATLTSDDGFHTSGSLETEVQRQKSADEQNIGVTAVVIANIADKTEKWNGMAALHEEIVAAGKGLSLDSQLPQEKKKPVLATASSESNAADAVEDKQVWQTLQGEMEEAATKIQSNFRGYRTRQRLHRENAVQVTTSSGTPGTTSESSDAPPPPPTTTATSATAIRSSGEFHDMLVLTPEPSAPTDVTSDSWDGVGVGVGIGVGVEDDALAECQASDLGTRLEGHVIAVSTPATDAVSAMGKAKETTSQKESSVKEMKGANIAKAAATKIQAGFRGYKVRKQMRQMQEKKNGPRRRSSVQPAPIVRDKMTLQDKSATTIQAGVRGFLVRKRRLEEKNAAVKIQAGFRGYKVRRDVKARAPVEK